MVEKEDYFYFLIFFSDYNKYDWRLGRPFMNKYNFMVDQDGKKYYFILKKKMLLYLSQKQIISYFAYSFNYDIFAFRSFSC